MINSESRYQEASKSFTYSHSYDQYGRTYLDGDSATPIPRVVARETLFRLSAPSPSPATPVEYVVRQGESLSYVAWKLMTAHSNWWKIAEANPSVWYPLDIQPGTSLRIPV